MQQESVSHPLLSREYEEYERFFTENLRKSRARKYLIVDDDPFANVYLEKLVRRFDPDAILVTATTVADAERTSIVGFDVAIIDFFLKDQINGLELCKRIHDTNPQTQFLMVSSLSSYHFQELVSHFQLTPDFIEKPVRADILFAHLDKLKEDPNGSNSGSRSN